MILPAPEMLNHSIQLYGNEVVKKKDTREVLRYYKEVKKKKDLHLL